MYLAKFELVRRPAFWFAAGVLVQAVGWRLLAPPAKCIVDASGACVWQLDAVSSPYFFRDAIFGGLGLLIGGLIGQRFGRRWWTFGFPAQLSVAIVGLLCSVLAAQLGRVGSSVTPIDAKTAFDALQLAAWPFWFAWPFATQFLVVWYGSDQLAGTEPLPSKK